MAKRKSTRRVRFFRNQDLQHRSRPDPAGGVAAAAKPIAPTVPENHGAAIEAARTNLRRAGAVLDCTHYVLLYDDQFEGDPERPSFSDAIDVARDLVRDVIDALDQVNLRLPGSE